MIPYVMFLFLYSTKSSDLLTYFALILAYNGYIWSINRDLDSWKSLFISFKIDLENQKGWLKNEYSKTTYKDKNAFSPSKIIFPLSFESLKEIIRRGTSEIPGLSKSFFEDLSIFNERVIAFNSFLDQIKKICSSNPVMSEKLKDELNKLGLDKENVSFDDLKNDIYKKKKSNNILYLAENIYRLNKYVHINLIGNKTNKDKLNYLYSKIRIELQKVIDNFEIKKPFFIKYKWIVILLSVPSFMILEILFR